MTCSDLRGKAKTKSPSNGRDFAAFQEESLLAAQQFVRETTVSAVSLHSDSTAFKEKSPSQSSGQPTARGASWSAATGEVRDPYPGHLK